MLQVSLFCILVYNGNFFYFNNQIHENFYFSLLSIPVWPLLRTVMRESGLGGSYHMANSFSSGLYIVSSGRRSIGDWYFPEHTSGNSSCQYWGPAAEKLND